LPKVAAKPIKTEKDNTEAILEEFYSSVADDLVEVSSEEDKSPVVTLQVTEIKGKVDIEVKNIFKEIGIYEFKRILQECGQIIEYHMTKEFPDEGR